MGAYCPPPPLLLEFTDIIPPLLDFALKIVKYDLNSLHAPLPWVPRYATADTLAWSSFSVTYRGLLTISEIVVLVVLDLSNFSLC